MNHVQYFPWLFLAWNLSWTTFDCLSSELGNTEDNSFGNNWDRLDCCILGLLFSLCFKERNWGWATALSNPCHAFLGGGGARESKKKSQNCLHLFLDWAGIWLLWIFDWFPEQLQSYFCQSLFVYLIFLWQNKILELPSLPPRWHNSLVMQHWEKR